jgi:hypothetical protein
MSDPIALSAAQLAELEQTLITWYQVAEYATATPETAAETAQWISFYRQMVDRERTRLAALRRGELPCI